MIMKPISKKLELKSLTIDVSRNKYVHRVGVNNIIISIKKLVNLRHLKLLI